RIVTENIMRNTVLLMNYWRRNINICGLYRMRNILFSKKKKPRQTNMEKLSLTNQGSIFLQDIIIHSSHSFPIALDSKYYLLTENSYLKIGGRTWKKAAKYLGMLF